jgi:glycosyltransferase involved in cell wall biosynthesis
MSQPFIDVVIPTYNSMPWIKATVKSVLEQTHANINVYIIDDGSKDDTESFVKSLKDKRIHYVKKENGGVSSARNVGIKHAKSEFIAFVDADDIWYPEKLEKQLKLLQKDSEVGLVYGHHYIIDEEDVVQRNLRIWKRGHVADELSGGNLIAGSASMVLIRRSILNQVGPFREDIINGEDWELWLRIALVSKVDFVPEILAAIRQHPSSAQYHTGNTKRMADSLIYAYGVMKQELGLTPLQRKRVASYCLYNAADLYLRMGERWQAKKILFYLFKENTLAFFQLENWKVHVSYGLFARVIFGNPVFDFVWRVVRKIFRLLGGLIWFCLRAVRFALRRIKHLVT